MKSDNFGKIYVGAMALYFLVSGFSVLFDIDAKLERIGLSAVDQDGRVAFILIYCSLMVGIGSAISIIAYISRTWLYSTILAVTIIVSFIVFRLVGASMIGALSSVQSWFILFELIEAAIGLLLIITYFKSTNFKID